MRGPIWPMEIESQIFLLELTNHYDPANFFVIVIVPELVRFGHENVHLSAITVQLLFGCKVYIFMQKLYTFRNFDCIVPLV